MEGSAVFWNFGAVCLCPAGARPCTPCPWGVCVDASTTHAPTPPFFFFFFFRETVQGRKIRLRPLSRISPLRCSAHHHGITLSGLRGYREHGILPLCGVQVIWLLQSGQGICPALWGMAQRSNGADCLSIAYQA